MLQEAKEMEVKTKPDVRAQAKEIAKAVDVNVLANLSSAVSPYIQAAKRLAEGEALTLRDLFWDGRAINVFGEIYPDLPAFSEPLDEKTTEVILRRYVSVGKAIQTTERRVARFAETFQKKMLKRAKALARMTKGSNVMRRQFLQTIRAEDLEPFICDGEYKNSLVFSRGATLTISFTETFRPDGEFIHDTKALVDQYMASLAAAVLDHTEALHLATGAKPKRRLEVKVNANGQLYGMLVENGKAQPLPSSPSDNPYPEVTLTLTYTLKIPKTNLDNALEALEGLKLPAYRSNFYTLLESAFRVNQQDNTDEEGEEVVF